MPRFNDQWVIDRTLFEFASGGSCACCGFSHLFVPQGIKGLIDDMSELETDAADAEYRTAKKSPWPSTLRDQIWADRVRLRHKMKREMPIYREFLEETGGREGLRDLLSSEIGAPQLHRLIQMPRTEVIEKVRSHYNIHSAFGNVVEAVVEQVANFAITGYSPDGRSDAELRLEEKLAFDRRGGFLLRIARRNEETKKFTEMNEDVLDALLDIMESLGGPKLLHRAPKKDVVGGDENDEEEKGDADADADANANADADAADDNEAGTSFRSDRRIIRLIIARYWADRIIDKCRIIMKTKKEQKKEEATNPASREAGVDAITSRLE